MKSIWLFRKHEALRVCSKLKQRGTKAGEILGGSVIPELRLVKGNGLEQKLIIVDS